MNALTPLEAAARRLLAAVDYTGAPHYNVRVRDLVTAAQALAALEAALAAVDGPGVDPPAFVRLRVLKRGALYPNPDPRQTQPAFADVGDLIFPTPAAGAALVERKLCEVYDGR